MVSVLVVVGGLAFAFRLTSLVAGLEIWLKIAPMLGIAFWMGLFWRRMTAAGAWACALAGFGTWFLTTRAPVVAWLEKLPYAGALRLTWEDAPGQVAELYEPWLIVFYTSAAVIAGIVVSLLTKRADAEQLDRFYALVKTPTRPGEQVERPCTLPPGTAVPDRPMLLTAFGLEVPMPSRTSLVGFAAGWVLVAALIAGFVWFVRG